MKLLASSLLSLSLHHAYTLPVFRAGDGHGGLDVVELLHGPWFRGTLLLRLGGLSHVDPLKRRSGMVDLAKAVVLLGATLLVRVLVLSVYGKPENITSRVGLGQIAGLSKTEALDDIVGQVTDLVLTGDELLGGAHHQLCLFQELLVILVVSVFGVKLGEIELSNLDTRGVVGQPLHCHLAGALLIEALGLSVGMAIDGEAVSGGSLHADFVTHQEGVGNLGGHDGGIRFSHSGHDGEIISTSTRPACSL